MFSADLPSKPSTCGCVGGRCLINVLRTVSPLARGCWDWEGAEQGGRRRGASDPRRNKRANKPCQLAGLLVHGGADALVHTHRGDID